MPLCYIYSIKIDGVREHKGGDEYEENKGPKRVTVNLGRFGNSLRIGTLPLPTLVKSLG